MALASYHHLPTNEMPCMAAALTPRVRLVSRKAVC
jgi:hypothetical protein